MNASTYTSRNRGFVKTALLWLLAWGAAGGFFLYRAAPRPEADAPNGGPAVACADACAARSPRTKKIEDIKIGEYVPAKDPDDPGPPTAHKVVALPRNWTEHVVHVAVSGSSGVGSGGEILATRLHPFWVNGRGWEFAKDLKPGDQLRDAAGQAVDVVSTWTEGRDAKTYNLSVEGVHTFYVAAGSAFVLVHNAPFGNVAGGGPISAGQALENATQYLGQGYSEIAPGVFRSADNLRQFRMTTSDLTDPSQGPHVHFESIGPDGRTITENSHVMVCP